MYWNDCNIMPSRKLWTTWIGQVRTVFCLLYIYCGVLVLSIQILQKSQAYNLYFRERTISPNCLKMLTPRQGSGKCSLLRIMILHKQETWGFLILKGDSFNNSIWRYLKSRKFGEEYEDRSYLSTESSPSKDFE